MRTVLFLACHLCCLLTSAYEIGCLYPQAMPDPIEAQWHMMSLGSTHSVNNNVETPVIVHGSLFSAMCGAACLSYHDDKVLHPITQKRPVLTAPKFGHNAYSIALCSLACHTVSIGYDVYKPLIDKWNAPITGIWHPDLEFLEVYRTNTSAVPGPDLFTKILQAIGANDFHPVMLGQLVAAEIYLAFREDGWNAFGEHQFDLMTETAVPCTHNCRPFADVSGYHPQNHPGRPYSAESKYNVSGVDMYWQPLLEDDGFGYFSRQEHVTPHLATTAKLSLDLDLRDKKAAPEPNYDYYQESLQVVEEMRKTANDPSRKGMITVFDNKLEVRGLAQWATQEQFPDQHSYQRMLLYVLGLSFAEDDGVIMAWTEKLRHDLVRPTTVIQRWGDDILTTFNGDPNSTEAQVIAARSFEAFIRVMPHSEYPSGSACLCTTYREFNDAYTMQNYAGKLENSLIYGPDGYKWYDWNCDLDFSSDLPRSLCEKRFGIQFTLKDMTELEEVCGQSRLWGGMHFSKSVPAGHELCEGIGTLALERINNITADSSFGGNEWFRGGDRPTCSDPLVDVSGAAISKNGEDSSAVATMPSSIAMMLAMAVFAWV